MSTEPVNEYELHAYIDGELADDRRAVIESHLALNPADSERVAAWREQKRMLHALFDPVLDEAIPRPIRQLIRRRRRLGWLAQAAMALVYVSVGLAAGRFLLPSAPSAADTAVPVAALSQQAALAHAVYTPEVLHPVEVRADQQAHLVKWLSKRLDHSLALPDLSADGFDLVGGRLLPGDRGPAAQFMFENRSGQRLTLFVRSDLAENHDTAFQFSRNDGISVFHWIDGHLGYALSGEMPREPLLAIATRIYAQINP